MTPDPVLREWAAAVAHDLRTPLTAVRGEVELALRRERSAAAYREALERINISVGELMDLSFDLATLASAAPGDHSAQSTVLARLLPTHPTSGGHLAAAFTGDVAALPIAGDERLLARMMTLLCNHAIRHCAAHARICLAATAPGRHEHPRGVHIILAAAPGGFPAATWLHLVDPGPGGSIPRAPGFLALRTCAAIAAHARAELEVNPADAGHALHIRLPLASPSRS